MEKTCARNKPSLGYKVELVPENQAMRALSVAVLTWVSSWDIRCGAVRCSAVRCGGVVWCERSQGRWQGTGPTKQFIRRQKCTRSNREPERPMRISPWFFKEKRSVCSWGWWKGAHRAWAAGSLRLRRCSHVHSQFINTREVILQITKEVELVFHNNPTGLFSIRGIQVKKYILVSNMKMASKKFQLSSMLVFRKSTDESSATHSISFCILLDLTAPLKGHEPCTQRWESKSFFEREGGREAPPKMDGFQGRYQDGLPMIMDPYEMKCYRYMTHNPGACSSLAKLESHGWWFMFPATVRSSQGLDTTILSPTVAKLIFSLSRRHQEVSKNPVSYAF